jgi:hypothetical protein
LQVSFISVYLPQEVKAAEDLKLTVTRSSSKKMASKVRLSKIQCCGSGSGAFLTSGSGMGKKIRIRIRDEHPGSYFRELRNNFFG